MANNIENVSTKFYNRSIFNIIRKVCFSSVNFIASYCYISTVLYTTIAMCFSFCLLCRLFFRSFNYRGRSVLCIFPMFLREIIKLSERTQEFELLSVWKYLMVTIVYMTVIIRCFTRKLYGLLFRKIYFTEKLF